MKNIHLIPTDKPSRLYKQTGSLSLDTISDTSTDGISINQHIYITSDEEIKEGDYVFNLTSKEVYPIFELWEVVSYEKKIILTTDQDLIKDGVQAIDDEFLEWFVKNPTCEEVEVIKVCSTGRKCDGKGKNCNMAKLKIIIPKEEQKQDYSGVHLRHCYQGEYEDGCKYGEDDCPAKPLEPKQETTGKKFYESADETITVYRQETIKKAAKSYRSSTANKMAIEQQAFQEGAKWQAERMYSEEEVYHILCEHTAFLFVGGKSTLSEWFERFKKK
jgi:hypothetical protein